MKKLPKISEKKDESEWKREQERERERENESNYCMVNKRQLNV